MFSHQGFLSALPKHKAELVNGQVWMSGSLKKSAMVLKYLIENLGAAYVLEICSKELLEEALIEINSHQNKAQKALADTSPVRPTYFPPQKLATDLRMAIFQSGKIFVSGGGTVIKLGEDAFMPDIYLVREPKRNQLTEYFFEGAPDLIIEVVHPYMRAFDFGIRMNCYAKAGVSEVWMLDFEKRTFEPFVLSKGEYVRIEVSDAWYVSASIPEMKVQQGRIFETTGHLGIQIPDIFEIDLPKLKRRERSDRERVVHGSVPFAPRLDLGPVSINFSEYISWGGEVKFEMIDGKPVFGGGLHTTQEWLGLLMMTLGVQETVKYLPERDWIAVL
jgi:hypothetical protein